MQPIKITILGDYYDCQIYRGRLYLWTFNGDLKVYEWNNLVQSFISKETDKIAMTFGFLDGNYLYKSSLIELFKDDDFKKLLLNKFSRLEDRNFTISEKEAAKYLNGEQETPTGILPTDTEIYSNKLYMINEKGLYVGSAHRDKTAKFPVSSRPNKIWDCNLLSIKANKYPQLALSGGDEGLYELNMAKSKPSNLKTIESKSHIYHISNKHSSFSNYSYLNIYNSSLIENSFMANFKWNEHKKSDSNDKTYTRDFDNIISDHDIFNDTDKKHFISWGIEDKIYKATKTGFEIIKVNNTANLEEGEERYNKLNSIELTEWKGKVIGGGTSYFGNIIECENALIITLSNDEIITIKGPITRWRIYPRSLNYENHLHVILDDRIEIYSFNQDYFIDQNDKKIGIEFRSNKRKNVSVSYFEDTDESMTYDFNSPDLPF